MTFGPYFWVCMSCLLSAVRGYCFVAVFFAVSVGFGLCEYAGYADLGLNFVGDSAGNSCGISCL